MQAEEEDVIDDISGHPLEKQMRALNDADIMRGYGNGKFLPDKLVTRAEFSAFLGRSLELPEGEKDQFTDVIGHSLAGEVNRAAAAGLINGIGGGLFAPDRTITREEMAVMVDRAVQGEGIERKSAILAFTDLKEIKYTEYVSHLLSLGIMTGFADQSFRPKEEVTRAQTAYTIYRMLEVIEKDREKKAKAEQEESEVDEDKKTINDEDSENPNYVKKDGVELLFDPDKEKAVISKGFTIIYKEDMATSITYVTGDTEMKYLGEDGERVKVQIADTVGYVNVADVEIEMKPLQEGRSFYKVEDGQLMHYVNRSNGYVSYLYGPAPEFLDEGEVDYSWNGKNYSQGVSYQYFNYLPLHTKTNYSAEELDQFVANFQPESPLIGLGETFKKMEEEQGVNALYLLAHAIHESAWGFSRIAREKNNLFGLRATDDNPYGNADAFNSLEDNIEYAAKYVKERYLTPGEKSFYHGAFLGNKSLGMNVYYASDPYWGQKIAGHMYRADLNLGGKDWGEYELAVSKVTSLNVRSKPAVGGEVLYQYEKAGMTMIILDKVKKSNGLWYKIAADDPDYDETYVYAQGELGDLVEVMPANDGILVKQ
jgi:beta-N-acetylglucosaminidase